MMLFRKIFLLLFLLLYFQVDAQQIFQKTFGSGLIETSARSFVTFNDGTIIIAGQKSESSFANILLLKIDSTGNTLWSKSIGDSSRSEISFDMIKCSDGNLAIIGQSNTGIGIEFLEIFLMKTDTAGNLLWSKSYGDSLGDVGLRIIESDNGNFVITGFYNYESVMYMRDQAFVLKTDSSGNILWSKIFGQACDSCLTAIDGLVPTPDKGFILAGATTTFAADLYDYDFFWMKIDSLGNMQWAKILSDSCSSITRQIISTNDSAYLITGWSCSYSGFFEVDIILIKINQSGNILWTQKYSFAGFGSFDQPYDVIQTNDNGFLISSGGVLIKTDSLGIVQWCKRYILSPYNNATFKIKQMPDNGYFTAGQCAPGGASNNAYIFKTDSSGYACFSANTTVNTSALTLTADSVSMPEFSISPYDSVLSLLNNNIILPDSVYCQTATFLSENFSNEMYIEIYPNPCIDFINVRILNEEIKENKKIDFSVFDFTGRVIYNSVKNNTESYYKIDVSNLSTGNYLIQLKIGNSNIINRKFVKMN